jgi:DNA-binding GntR family transcriptional regulator
LILLGEVPLGVRLGEEKIAERIGVSRTPVREALLRLHAERFLERHPDGGFRAASPSVKSLRELYEVRTALELFAVERPHRNRSHFDVGALTELRDEWGCFSADVDTLDAEFVLIDEDFHYRLAHASGNDELAEELRKVNERIRPVRSHDFLTPGRIVTTVAEHLAIVDALLSRSLQRASKLLEQHITESQTVVEMAVASTLERMLSIGERGGAW